MHDISNSLTATNTIYLTYLLPNLIFIHIIQDHLQEVTIMLNTNSFSRYGVNIHSRYFQKKMIILIYRVNNKNFLKTRLLIFVMYMTVNLIKLNLFLFICLYIYHFFLLFFSSLSYDPSVYILHTCNHCSPLLTAGSGYCFFHNQ